LLVIILKIKQKLLAYPGNACGTTVENNITVDDKSISILSKNSESDILSSNLTT